MSYSHETLQGNWGARPKSVPQAQWLNQVSEKVFQAHFGRTRKSYERLLSRKVGQESWAFTPRRLKLHKPSDRVFFVEVSDEGTGVLLGWARHSDILTWPCWIWRGDVTMFTGSPLSMEEFDVKEA